MKRILIALLIILSSSAAKAEKISEIIPGKLYVGGAASAGPRTLKANDIEVVINCYLDKPAFCRSKTTKIESRFPTFNIYQQAFQKGKKLTVIHYCKKIQGEIRTKIYNLFEETNEIIEDAIKKGKKVLIHCQNGQHRSGAICAGYLMEKENWSLKQTYEYIKGI